MLSVSYLQLVMSASAAPGRELVSFLPRVFINLVEPTVLLPVQELHAFYPPLDCHWRNKGLPDLRCLATHRHRTWGRQLLPPLLLGSIQHPLL